MFQKLFLICALAVLGETLHLASYITACKKDDPDLNTCARTSANKAIPILAKGDHELKTPSLIPLKLPVIEIHASQNLDLKLTDAKLYGLEKVVVKDMNIDLEKQHCSVTVWADYLSLSSTYEIKGQILVLPISGSGPMNLTCYDSSYDYVFDFEFVERDGKRYANLVNPTITFKIKKSVYHFENLFDGDQKLGEEMNKFLNENDQQVSKDLSPSISETINTIATSLLKSVFDRVPYDEIFL